MVLIVFPEVTNDANVGDHFYRLTQAYFVGKYDIAVCKEGQDSAVR